MLLAKQEINHCEKLNYWTIPGQFYLCQKILVPNFQICLAIVWEKYKYTFTNTNLNTLVNLVTAIGYTVNKQHSIKLKYLIVNV